MIRRSPLYGIALEFFVPGSHWADTCNNLRNYVNRLDTLITAFRKTAEANPRGADFHLFAKRSLLAQIAKATSTPPYNRLAELLNAAYGVADLSASEESSALRHLWKSHIKKNAQRRYRRMALTMNLYEEHPPPK